ncbi:MAG: serine hydrolase [Gemmatimonadales bacterium]
MTVRARWILAPLTALAAACGGGSTNPNPAPPPPPPGPAPVASVAVSPDTTVLVPGGTRQFTATPRDASGNPLTGRTVTWSTGSQTTATVSTSGLVTAVAAGTTQLQAVSEGRTGTAMITVLDGGAVGAAGGVVSRPDSAIVLTIPAGALAQSRVITITPVASPPAHPGLASGTAYDLGPDGTTFAQPATIRLGYSATAVASLDQSRLRLHRYQGGTWQEVPGSTVDQASRTVTGLTSSFSRYAVVALPGSEVASVSIDPDSADVEYRATKALTAAALDGEDAPIEGKTVTWQSSNPAIASVSESGVVTGVLPGTVTITATSDGIQGSARIRVVASDLNRIVDSIRQAFNLPAMGAGIVTRAGGLVSAGVGGVRRFGDATPVTVADKWHLGSNAKTMTSFLAALAVADGRLAWTDLMTDRYPELAAIARPEFTGLTLRQLATMQSAIIGNPGFTPTGTLADQRSAVDAWAVQQPPVGSVGDYYYSNVAYQILGEIAGRAFGNGYEQAMRDRLWDPLGVTSGGFGPTTGAGMTDQPIGHVPGPGGWTVCEACDNSWATGSGKIHMSLPDWARVIHEILKADAGESTLLGQGAAQGLTTPASTINASTAYGFGWVVFTGIAQRVVTHDGSNNRNRSRSLVYLTSGVAYLITTNAGDPAANGGAPNAAANAMVTRLQQYWQTGQ